MQVICSRMVRKPRIVKGSSCRGCLHAVPHDKCDPHQHKSACDMGCELFGLVTCVPVAQPDPHVPAIVARPAPRTTVEPDEDLDLKYLE